MKKLSLFLLAALLSAPALAQAPKVKAKGDTVKHHVFDTSITFKKPTQDRLTDLQARIEELQAIAKLLKKNDDILGIVNQRVGLLAREHQDQLRTLYENQAIDYTAIARDSVAGETLYLDFKREEKKK